MGIRFVERSSVAPNAILVASFCSFYILIELLLFGNRDIFGPSGFGNDIVMLLVSFLNITPAGIFAFAVASALPKRLSSSFNDETLMKFLPLKSPKVAVLYTTYNDFLPSYAKYDCEQTRKLCYQFCILDDSTDPKKRLEVDQFASAFGCEVLRRNSRKGFKAGAMNNWLWMYGSKFDYIFILDSDSKASTDSIQECVELARRDPALALVQSKTLTMTSEPSEFTKSSVVIQHAYMAIVQNAMRNLGSSPFYGHNALVKIQALKEVGGFVEESNEDYKTLAKFHGKGFRSVYASQAITWEEVPLDYYSSRKRATRWARDAVGQLGLLRFRAPLAMVVYLIYGWATYMANLALFTLFLLLAYSTISLEISSMGFFGGIAGILTISVLSFWPLLALRVKDPLLTPKKILKAVLWGSAFSMPMVAPLTAQIIRTLVSKIGAQLKGLFQGGSKLVEEFTVTPKIRAESSGFLSVVKSLKIEILGGSMPILLALLSGSLGFLLFSTLQIASLMMLPFLVFHQANSGTIIQSEKHIHYAGKKIESRKEFFFERRTLPQSVTQYVRMMVR